MSKTFKVGRYELPVREVEDSHVPKHADEFVDHDGVLESIAYAVSADVPIMLIGDTGTGKTSAIRYLAKQTNTPYRRVSLNGATTKDELIGRMELLDGETVWVDGVLPQAMKRGDWIVLDELNAALPEVMFAIHALLDDDRQVVLDDREKTVVRPHEGFRLFATMNPSDGYSGTKDPNRALMSRFHVVQNVDYPKPSVEAKILVSRAPKNALGADELAALASTMVKFAEQNRRAYRSDESDFILSTRDLIGWMQVAVGWGLTDTSGLRRAAELTFLYKANRDDRKALEAALELTVSGAEEKILTKEDIVTLATSRVEYVKVKKAFEHDNRKFKPGDVMAVTTDGRNVVTWFIEGVDKDRTDELLNDGHGHDGTGGRRWNVKIDALAEKVSRCARPSRYREEWVKLRG